MTSLLPKSDFDKILISGICSMIGLILFITYIKNNNKPNSTYNLAIIFSIIGLLPTLFMILLLVSNSLNPTRPF